MKPRPIFSLAVLVIAVIATSQTADAQLTFEFEFTGIARHHSEDEAISRAHSLALSQLDDYMDALFFAYGASAISSWIVESDVSTLFCPCGPLKPYSWRARYTIRGTIVLWPAGAGL